MALQSLQLSWQASSSDVTVTTATLAVWHWQLGSSRPRPTISQRRGPDTKIADLHVLNKPQQKGSTTQHQVTNAYNALQLWYNTDFAWHQPEKKRSDVRSIPTFYSSSSPLLLGDPAILYTVEKNQSLGEANGAAESFGIYTGYMILIDIVYLYILYYIYNYMWYILDIYWIYIIYIYIHIYIYICVCDILYNVLYILVYCFLLILTSLQSSNPSVDLRCMVPLWLLLRDPSVRGQQPTSVRPRRLQMVSDESLEDRFVLFMFCLCSVSIIRFHLFHSLYYILYSFVLTRYHDCSFFSGFNFFPTQDLLMLRLPAALASSVAPRRSAKSLSPTDNPIKDPCNDIGYRTLMNHIDYWTIQNMQKGDETNDNKPTPPTQ